LPIDSTVKWLLLAFFWEVKRWNIFSQTIKKVHGPIWYLFFFLSDMHFKKYSWVTFLGKMKHFPFLTYWR
jgi:hypothetical protein